MSEGKPYYGDGANAGSTYCYRCAPEGLEPEALAQEVDSPEHCCVCHAPLDCSYTEACQEYVMDAIQEVINDWDNTRNAEIITDMKWYEGLPHVAIVLDWAKELGNHTMEQSDRILVDWLIENVESEYNFGVRLESGKTVWLNRS